MVLTDRRYVPRVDPAEFRTRVTLLSSAVTKAASGAQVVTYSDFTTKPTVWAKIVFAHGIESVSSDATKSTKRMTMTIRYRSDVDSTCGVRLPDGSEWKFIGTPDNIQHRNQYLEIQCELVKGTV